MAEFNLIDEPWIPCIDTEGNSREYGIRDVLLKAHELREICDDSPLVTVSLHRLFLAILYRVFEGPKYLRDWRELYKIGRFQNDSIDGYFTKWKDRFYLFDDKFPFYQMGDFQTKNPISVNRLATEIASGNNATLFDHGNDDEEVAWTPAFTAKNLVACQAFALGFGRSSNATFKGKYEPIPYSSDAIALRGMNLFLQGEMLFETLMINLNPEQDDSLPPWELNDTNLYRDKLNGKDRTTMPSFGIIDRFTWQSRLVGLIQNNGLISKMYFTQGRSADKSAGDPMKIYRKSREEGISPLSLSSIKAAWRDAHTILTIPDSQSNERRPSCLSLVDTLRITGSITDKRSFITHIIGLAAAPNKAGKFLLWRHERIPVPAALMSDTNLIERLGTLIANAEYAAGELRTRLRRIAKLYLAPASESPGSSQPDPSEINKIADTIDPRPIYWSRMEDHFYKLLQSLPDDWSTKKGEWKPENQMTATNEWRTNIKKEAQKALEESVRSLGTTARAIQAVARVRTTFYDDDLENKKNKNTKKGGE